MKCKYCNQEIKEIIIEEEKPKIIGTLNKKFGYNNCKDIEIGSYVYEFDNSYYFIVEQNNGLKFNCKFYKNTLKPCIDFI